MYPLLGSIHDQQLLLWSFVVVVVFLQVYIFKKLRMATRMPMDNQDAMLRAVSHTVLLS